MPDFQPIIPPAPSCPMCAHEMGLKQIHRQPPEDHFVFKCRRCELEYPVAKKRE